MNDPLMFSPDSLFFPTKVLAILHMHSLLHSYPPTHRLHPYLLPTFTLHNQPPQNKHTFTLKGEHLLHSCRIQQAEDNRMFILKDLRQRRASPRERSSQSWMRRVARESKYKECVRAAIHRKRAASERGAGNVDASTDVLVDDSLLNDEAQQPLFSISTVDPLKEPPLLTTNIVLSILAVEYPVDKVSCYGFDFGAAMLTCEALAETSDFARKWVPFCKKHNIKSRAPGWYFTQKMEYSKDKVQPSFVKDRRAMRRESEEFKVSVNGLIAKAQKVLEEGWMMQNNIPWPGNNNRDHPGMIQVFLSQSGGLDSEARP